MNLNNCPECGRAHLGSGLCRECLAGLEREFERLREYLRGNPGAQLESASEATGLPTAKILKFLKEGRIRVSSPATPPPAREIQAPRPAPRQEDAVKKRTAAHHPRSTPGRHFRQGK